MIKNLRGSQKLILIIALIIVFYLLICPEFFSYGKTVGGTLHEYSHGRQWLWEGHNKLPYTYSKMILDVLITCVGTGIALLIESLMCSKK